MKNRLITVILIFSVSVQALSASLFLKKDGSEIYKRINPLDKGCILPTPEKGRTVHWEYIGIPGFSRGTSIDSADLMIVDEVLYVSMEEIDPYGISSPYASVYKYEGNFWESVGPNNISTDPVNRTRLAHANGQLYLAYNKSTHLEVKKFNDTNWEDLSAASPKSNSTTGRIDFYAAGSDVYIGYRISNPYPDKAFIKKLTGSNWVKIDEFNMSKYDLNFQFVLDDTNLYATYNMCDYPDGPVYSHVEKYNGTSWDEVGDIQSVIGTKAEIQQISVAPDCIYATIYCKTNTIAKWAIVSYDGSAWDFVGQISELSNHKIQSICYMEAIYIAYTHASEFDDKARVKKFDGHNWAQVGKDGFTIGYANNLHLATDGHHVYIMFRDESYSQRITVMKCIE